MPVGGAIEKLFSDLLNPKDRDYVSQNTPMNAELFNFLLNAPKGSRGSVSASTGRDSADKPVGTWDWPEAPPEFNQVQSVMPEAIARGGLNEATLKDYTDALEIFNTGGKGEKIAGVLQALAATGGYIADRTSSDPSRRAQSSADLDPALQSLFSISGAMRGKREGELKGALSAADRRRKLRGESIGAKTTAKTQDNVTNLAWRSLMQRGEADRTRASGSTPRIPFEEREYYDAKRFYEGEFTRDNPGLSDLDLWDKFVEEQPRRVHQMGGKTPYGKDYETASTVLRNTLQENWDYIDEKYKKQLYDVAGDPEATKALELKMAMEAKRRGMAVFGISDEDINDDLLRRVGIDLSTPQPGPPPEDPGFFDTVAGYGVKATDAIGDVLGGDFSFLEGLGIDPEHTKVLNSIFGGEGAPPDDDSVIDTKSEEPPKVGSVSKDGLLTVTAVADNEITVEGVIDGQKQTMTIPMEFSGPVGEKSYKLDLSKFRELATPQVDR